jgi:hemerythrin-like domain-containing protein
MTTIVVIVVVIVVVALAVGVAVAVRRRRLQQQFGPEYDRLAREHDSKRKAEAELAQRQRRVRKLDIKPLSAETQAAYAAQWISLQERFVDDPEDAVAQSQTLVASVMQDRGYPTEHHDQIAADLSVEHAKTIGNFRAAEEISSKATTGSASTEDLRQAMIHYRALFRDLLGDIPGPDDEPDVNDQVDGDYAATARTVSGHVPAATERDPARNGQVRDEPARDEPVYDEPVYDETVRGDAASDPAVPPAADPATEDASRRPTRRS